jgi:hypothetical protein
MHDSRFRASGNGNSNARLLGYVLKQNVTIEELNLEGTGLDDDGMIELCEGLKNNSTVKSLNVSSNHFGVLGTEILRLALDVNKSVKKLDVSRNALGFQSISSLLCTCQAKSIQVNTSGNFIFEEILNSVSHGVAFIFAVVGTICLPPIGKLCVIIFHLCRLGCILLVNEAADDKYSDYHFWSCVLYSFSLLFLFLSSCLFHSFFMLPTSE